MSLPWPHKPYGLQDRIEGEVGEDSLGRFAKSLFRLRRLPLAGCHVVVKITSLWNFLGSKVLRGIFWVSRREGAGAAEIFGFMCLRVGTSKNDKKGIHERVITQLATCVPRKPLNFVPSGTWFRMKDC